MAAGIPPAAFDRAMAAARDLAAANANARRIELANEIDLIVGRVLWDGTRHRISWPRRIAEVAREPERHFVEVS